LNLCGVSSLHRFFDISPCKKHETNSGTFIFFGSRGNKKKQSEYPEGHIPSMILLILKIMQILILTTFCNKPSIIHTFIQTIPLKSIHWIILVALLVSTGCTQPQNTVPNYVEAKPSFFSLRHGKWVNNKWIRRPGNLQMIHETFKIAGYSNLLYNNLPAGMQPVMVQDIYINKSLYHLLDSLVLSYNNPDIGVKYYREFWQRRKAEQNDSIVYIIIKDIQEGYRTKLGFAKLAWEADSTLANDTLLSLLQMEHSNDTLTGEVALQHFTTLRDMGFHQSAYNLLYERSRYYGKFPDPDDLAKALQRSDSSTYAWFDDNTK